jgi:hypothetical protein
VLQIFFSYHSQECVNKDEPARIFSTFTVISFEEVNSVERLVAKDQDTGVQNTHAAEFEPPFADVEPSGGN